ncbi:MAG TPA: tail fiber protein [Pyrinomonadaceae bacterium]
MPEPYVGEIRMFGGNFPPAGWMFCDGALIPISENDVLFTLLGTTYGGDGESTFALPDLRGRVPMHQGTFAGQTFVLGEQAGVEQVTLTVQQIPIHNHALIGSNTPAVTQLPGGNVPAQSTGQVYTSASSQINMYNQSITPVGGSQPHENMQPYLCINFIISLFGIFPPPQ